MSNFQHVQRELTQFIRNPDASSGLPGIEDRRLAIYRDLFFNNINGFLSNGFPVCRSLYSDSDWGSMVRDFMIRHQCASPYFLKIAEEFLEYLQHQRSGMAVDPPFLAELAHYEWVELALDVAVDELPSAVEPPSDILDARWRLSSLAWPLAYGFPVHQISRDNRPAEVTGDVTYIVVYRDRADSVEFLEINAVTARLLALFDDASSLNAYGVLKGIAAELGVEAEAVVGFGRELVTQLVGLDILIIAES
ncbi:putative DNA-binding domain-containing protein [uncultured Zhongshania sp.]|uniref:HvfC family RiPP maturation protein n=1 Tax=uncultured Zhongshania sp. TaxID=1642288 RepID=UPI0025FC4959|nr:putative DNA-binding domain-containing protein [uncultured Zhongshania sp.]